MAFRYFAILCSDASLIERISEQVQMDARLPFVHCLSGLTLFSNQKDAVLDVASHGVVLGHLFTRPPAVRRVWSLPVEACDDIAQTQGGVLIDKFWGGYVAIVRQPGAEGFCLLRDPSGALPCYYMKISGAFIVSSDLETIYASGLFTPRVDWDGLAHHLRLPDLRTPKTCLTGLTELLSGHRFDGKAMQVAWSPWDHTKPAMACTADLVDELRETVSSCVTAWAQSYSHVLQGVSGGLDSSIVAAVTQASQTRLTCLTMASADGGGDEREYARCLATSIGAPLLEHFHQSDQVDILSPTTAHLPRPQAFAFGQSERAIKVALAKSLGIDAFFSGIGGDNVFCNMHSGSPLVDRWRSEGLSLNLFKTLDDLCALTGASRWAVMTAGLDRAGTSQDYVWPMNTQFLEANPCSDAANALAHPWLRDASNRLPGKAAHVAKMVRIQGTIDGYPRMTMGPQINPLLSQPIVELCLSIPTWLWCASGQDRSLARQAFSSILPGRLISRRSKGSPDGFAYRVMEANKPAVRNLLLNGTLADKGILDLPSLDAALSLDRPVRPLEHLRLAALAETEAWLQFWMGRISRPSLERMADEPTF